MQDDSKIGSTSLGAERNGNVGTNVRNQSDFEKGKEFEREKGANAEAAAPDAKKTFPQKVTEKGKDAAADITCTEDPAHDIPNNASTFAEEVVEYVGRLYGSAKSVLRGGADKTGEKSAQVSEATGETVEEVKEQGGKAWEKTREGVGKVPEKTKSGAQAVKEEAIDVGQIVRGGVKDDDQAEGQSYGDDRAKGQSYGDDRAKGQSYGGDRVKGKSSPAHD